jgi:hypothetical protein
MEPWIIFLILSIICLVIGIIVPKNNKMTTPPAALTSYNGPAVDSSLTSSDMSNLPTLSQWNESAITAQLRQLRDQRPSLIPHFVDSVKERFILKQDDRTAEVRLRFMQHQIEQLRLTKDFQQLRDDLEILAYQREKRIKTLELENKELDIKKDSLTGRQQLEALREQKRIELEIAQLDDQIGKIKNAPKAAVAPSPEEQRRSEKAAIEEDIQRLKQEKQKALKLDDESERVQRVNAIEDAIQRKLKRWGDLL